MTFLLTVLAFIVIFSLLVLIHECGHFFMARKSGIQVEEFGFGLPPRIWGIKKGETLYSINAIPFGGFVRLLGEDAQDPKVLKNPRSFASKPVRIRVMVVLAGVVMNFLLAFVLLTIGFTFGIQPLILSGDDVLNGLSTGLIQTEQGMKVKSVTKDSAADRAGMMAGDTIVSIDSREIISLAELNTFIKKSGTKPVVVGIARGQDAVKFLNLQAREKEDLGFEPYEVVFLPRLVIHDLSPDSLAYKDGLRSGDVILKMNALNVYTLNDFQDLLERSKDIIFTVSRDRQIFSFTVHGVVNERTLISYVYPDTPASKAGFQSGDVVVKANDQMVVVPQDLLTITHNNSGKTIHFTIRRQGALQEIDVIPSDQGLIGVALSTLIPYQNHQISVYGRDQAASVLKINDVRYPFWVAPFKALEESYRLSVLTVQMFGNVLQSFFTRFAIPDGVSGPVGIAQLTYTFVQQGVLSLLRFMALLSLSLAIINVLPFPALDGGRLLFIVFEVILGRRVSSRFESLIHAFGFLLLMALIFAVTYSDIVKLF